jgi:hypothetical protein
VVAFQRPTTLQTNQRQGAALVQLQNPNMHFSTDSTTYTCHPTHHHLRTSMALPHHGLLGQNVTRWLSSI